MTNFNDYRYGTMSSLERLPSDETDDGNVRLTEPDTTKNYNAGMFPIRKSGSGRAHSSGNRLSLDRKVLEWTPRTGKQFRTAPCSMERRPGKGCI